MSTLSFAQLPSSRADIGQSPLMAFGAPAPTPSSPPAGEPASLTNPPSYPGGQRALEAYVESLDMYPLRAREAGREGTVRVRFRVLPNGYLNGVRVVQSRGPLLDQAAVGAVERMPRWYPAHWAGMAVSHWVELPITFRLNQFP